MNTAELRNIPTWSVVRLSDGRIGILGRGSRRAIVLLDDHNGLAVELPLGTHAEVVAYPVATAQAYLRELQASEV